MKNRLATLLTLTFMLGGVSTASLATNQPVTVQYSGINNIRFHDPEFDNAFAGNGFLLRYQGEIYGATVKHVLFEAKTPQMKTVALSPWLKEWRIHPSQSPDEYVVFGELLNANNEEAIGMNIMQKDWLIFRVKENHSSLTPIEVRDTPLVEGERVTAFGCSYARKEACQQDSVQGIFVRKEGNNLRVSMPELKISALRGLSGSPVLDQAKKLVGIVSNVLPSESSEGLDFAPANLDYLFTVLKSVTEK